MNPTLSRSIPSSVIAVIALFLLCSCGTTPPDDPANPIVEVSIFQQGEDLFANVRLDSKYLDERLKEMGHGEPVLASYRFEFYRQQDNFFDLRLSHQIIQRRVRLRLITQRFEMMDLPQRRLQYTADEDEAMNFFGAPRYIHIGSEVQLPKNNRYYLKVGFTVEHQGMSWVLGVLNRLLTMTPPVIHEKIVWLQNP
ncbi:MAG: DUF4390 domain-containing protein [Magnetococcales bacterium]|nr:DUF4390 domain-containing protein [Magnetococcales bacterium]MBF0150861.1 DUF4390 domain-containing protein [Magnetococcales bacterium]MBF0173856.1 DUF4390 domain-containing protein [Magnetococcales bacterium]MBF0347006.1 DUF4390 domain-containing protein [Magnetococcales bacterium]MBF0631326.1 DUF4390 domain-containing protein [Magnetococcales bacterium]